MWVGINAVGCVMLDPWPCNNNSSSNSLNQHPQLWTVLATEKNWLTVLVSSLNYHYLFWFQNDKKISLKSFNSIHYPFSAWELQHEFCPYSAPLTVCVQHRYHKQRFKSNFWQIDFVLDIVKVWQCQWWFTASWWPGWHWPVCRPLGTGGHGLTELREKLRHQV